MRARRDAQAKAAWCRRPCPCPCCDGRQAARLAGACAIPLTPAPPASPALFAPAAGCDGVAQAPAGTDACLPCPWALPFAGSGAGKGCLGCAARADASRQSRLASGCLVPALWACPRLPGAACHVPTGRHVPLAPSCSQPSGAGRGSSPSLGGAGWRQVLCSGALPLASGGHSKRPPSLAERRSGYSELSWMLRRCRRR